MLTWAVAWLTVRLKADSGLHIIAAIICDGIVLVALAEAIGKLGGCK
jgi:hypothetical protein